MAKGGLSCPKCGAGGSVVTDSRPHFRGSVTYRRRQCATCRWRFTSYERTGLTLPNNQGFIEHLDIILASAQAMVEHLNELKTILHEETTRRRRAG